LLPLSGKHSNAVNTTLLRAGLPGAPDFSPAAGPGARGNGGLSLRQMLICVALAVVVATGTFWAAVRSNGEHSLVWSDGLAYFLYARSAVIDGDFDISNEYADMARRVPKDSKLMEPLRVWTTRDVVTGKVKAPWPVGAGLVMAPFYAVGYGIERVVASAYGRDPDSYGLIPQYAFGFGALAYMLAGFFAMVKCYWYVAPAAAVPAAMAVILAGPMLFYTFFNPTMAHAPSFGLVAVLTLLWWQQWHKGTDPTRFAVIGLLSGILVTVRFQNALFGLLPLSLLFHEARRSGPAHAARCAAAGVIAGALPLLVLLPPLAELHLPGSTAPGNGSVVVGNYPIDPRSPFFVDVLFSSRHGAFYWAPLLGVGALGLLIAARRHAWAWVALAAVAANVWLIGGLGIQGTAPVHGVPANIDWNNHWNGAPSFGMRYLAECGPLLGIGLARVFSLVATRVGAVAIWVALAGFTVWNGLLVLAYGFETISRSYAQTYFQLITGAGRAVARLAGLGS